MREPPTPSTFHQGELLRRWRVEKARLSLGAFAERLQVSKSQVFYWESGERTLDPASVARIDDHVFRSGGLFPALAKVTRHTAALEPNREWWWQFSGASSPVWAWFLPGPGSPVVSAVVRWGPLEVNVEESCGPEGFILTLPLSAPDPPVKVTLVDPAWVGFGRGKMVPELGIPIISALRRGVHLHRPLDPALRVCGVGLQDLLDVSADWRQRLKVLLRARPDLLEEALNNLPEGGQVFDLSDHPPTSRSPVLTHWPAERYQKLRKAHGLTQIEVAKQLSALCKGAVSDDQVSNLEEGREVKANWIWARLDLLYQADGTSFFMPLDVPAVLLADSGRPAWKVSAPDWWHGPVWFHFTAPRGDATPGLIELRWRPWRKQLLLRPGAVISTRKAAGDDADGPLVSAPPAWRLAAGLGRHPDALAIDHDWEPMDSRSMKELWERHAQTYFQLCGSTIAEFRDFCLQLRSRFSRTA